ncbi:TIGR01244 family sulfur transferase [Sphingomonas bacterium]|uniref:TIGR01244 family sulfur transferase n=1 Tax=Sphingomonas bacterium TaxID=1895847 RepID=UPI001576E3C0|nr:TIGR01244 family sulfur transferase [Sphingomonas bacterium]
MFRTLDEKVSVAGQITPADVAAAAAQGYAAIVNNRPDGEEPGQVPGAEIAAAAAAAGLAYSAIPVDHSGFDQRQIDAMAAALDAAGGPVLAFCRSGTRSTYLWALASAKMGAPAEGLVAKAAAQGYDLGPLRPMLDSL